jgi:hypothetical protein
VSALTFEMSVATAAAIRPYIHPWREPLDLCCLVAIHNCEPCYACHWPLAVRVVTRLPADYFSDESIADREEAKSWDFYPDW